MYEQFADYYDDDSFDVSVEWWQLPVDDVICPDLPAEMTTSKAAESANDTATNDERLLLPHQQHGVANRRGFGQPPSSSASSSLDGGQPCRSRSPHDSATLQSSSSPDAVLLGEFCELEGPKPLLSCPVADTRRLFASEAAASAAGGGSVGSESAAFSTASSGGGISSASSRSVFTGLNQLIVQILSTNYQCAGAHQFSLVDDTFMVNTSTNNPCLVLYFTLYDPAARGHVRPFCLAYLSADRAKLTAACGERIHAGFSRIAGRLRRSNMRWFQRRLSQLAEDIRFTTERHAHFVRTAAGLTEADRPAYAAASETPTHTTGTVADDVILGRLSPEALNIAAAEVARIQDVVRAHLAEIGEPEFVFSTKEYQTKLVNLSAGKFSDPNRTLDSLYEMTGTTEEILSQEMMAIWEESCRSVPSMILDRDGVFADRLFASVMTVDVDDAPADGRFATYAGDNLEEEEVEMAAEVFVSASECDEEEENSSSDHAFSESEMEEGDKEEDSGDHHLRLAHENLATVPPSEQLEKTEKAPVDLPEELKINRSVESRLLNNLFGEVRSNRRGLSLLISPPAGWLQTVSPLLPSLWQYSLAGTAIRLRLPTITSVTSLDSSDPDNVGGLLEETQWERLDDLVAVLSLLTAKEVHDSGRPSNGEVTTCLLPMDRRSVTSARINRDTFVFANGILYDNVNALPNSPVTFNCMTGEYVGTFYEDGLLHILTPVILCRLCFTTTAADVVESILYSNAHTMWLSECICDAERTSCI